MNILKLAAFSHNGQGGNPAGVAFCDEMPSDEEMLKVAKEVGYSETAFLVKQTDAWRVRYFAPALEVPFCGHATLALGAALAVQHGDGVFPLELNDGRITVEGWSHGGALAAALQSPPTRSAPADAALTRAALILFGYADTDLDPR